MSCPAIVMHISLSCSTVGIVPSLLQFSCGDEASLCVDGEGEPGASCCAHALEKHFLAIIM